MPSEPWVWIVIILAVALVASLAIWKGGHFKLTSGKDHGIEVEASGKPDREAGQISVLDRGTIRGSELGEIVGARDGQAPAGEIDVMRRGTIERGAKIGSIVGREVKGP